MSAIEFRGQAERPLAPDLANVRLRFSEKAVQELEALFVHYPDKKSCTLPALWIAQREYGWCSPEAIAEVAVRLGSPYVEVEGVATFYTMYHKHKPGRHVIEICTCLTCSIVGAYRLVDFLKDRLGIGPGETTGDGIFTIEEVECLDWCEAAPALQIGDTYEGNVTPERMDAILDRLRNTEESTIATLANSIIKCHLHAREEGN